MNSKINKETTNKEYTFLTFPNKLNGLALVAIIVLYGALLFGVISLSFPKYNYVVKIYYDPSSHNDELNAFALIRGTAEKDPDDPERIINTTRLSGYLRNMSDKSATGLEYSYSALDGSGIMRYFLDNKKSNTSGSDNLSQIIVPKDDLETLYVKVKYNINVDGTLERKELKFREEILQLKKRDLSKYQTENSIANLLEVAFVFRESTSNINQYQTKFRISLFDRDTPHHINFQSWLVTENNDIYSLMGLYNYRHNMDFEHAEGNYSDNIKYLAVNKFIKPQWIYSKLVYTNVETGVVSELLYKIKVSDLLA